MIKEQVLQTNLDEYSRCEEQAWLQPEAENNQSPFEKTDAALEEKINHALWKDDVLRVTDNNEIDIHVKNGIVYMSGHLLSSTNRNRVEKALQTVEGIRGSRSKLVMDDGLMLEVAASLGNLEHDHQCKFFTGVTHGVVVLNGEVSSMEVRKAAERCAASHPHVRGVINYIHVPGFDPGLQDFHFLQPPIGKEICFRDGVTGIVQQVVINPNNRLVVAMTLKGRISDSRQNLSLSDNSGVQPVRQLMVIPMSVVEHLTSSSGFLTIKSTDFTKYQKFDASSFTSPEAGWVPPYPYCPEDILFPADDQQAGNIASNLNQAPAMRKTGEQVLGQQLLTNDSLGG